MFRRGLCTVYIATTKRATTLSPTVASFVPAGTTSIQQPNTTAFSPQDLALVLVSTKKDHLPDYTAAQYSYRITAAIRFRSASSSANSKALSIQPH